MGSLTSRNSPPQPPGRPPWDVTTPDVSLAYWRWRASGEIGFEGPEPEPPAWVKDAAPPADGVSR